MNLKLITELTDSIGFDGCSNNSDILCNTTKS